MFSKSFFILLHRFRITNFMTKRQIINYFDAIRRMSFWFLFVCLILIIFGAFGFRTFERPFWRGFSISLVLLSFGQLIRLLWQYNKSHQLRSSVLDLFDSDLYIVKRDEMKRMKLFHSILSLERKIAILMIIEGIAAFFLFLFFKDKVFMGIGFGASVCGILMYVYQILNEYNANNYSYLLKEK